MKPAGEWQVPAMSFDGDWQLTISSPMGERPARLSISETTGSLEGSLVTGMGTARVSGHANGSSVEFNASVQGPMGAVKLDFTGTVTGDEVAGQMQFGSMGDGRWSGARVGAEEGEHAAPGASGTAPAESAQSASGSAVGGGRGGMGPGAAATATMGRPPGLGLRSFTSLAALRRTFDSLSVPTYRNLWIGFLLQMGGMQMMLMTGGYYVYELTGIPSLLGVVIAAAAVPAVSLALFGGVFADRFEKKRIIQFGQVVSLIAALFIGASITTGTITWIHLMAASFVQGCVMPLIMPARQAIVPQLVGMERLQNAVALNSMVMSLTTMAAPTFAGALIAALGIELVYYVIAGMFVASLFFTNLLPKLEGASGSRQSTIMTEMKDGLRYAASNRAILLLLLLSFSTIIFAMPIRFILPIFAADVFLVGPDRLGVMLGAIGLGSLFGTLVIAFLGKFARRGLALLLSGVASGLILLGFSTLSYLEPVYIAALVILTLVGVVQAGRMTLTNSLMMENADQEYRGRVMSLFSLNMGLMPAGVLPITFLADRIGAPLSLGIMAVLLILVATTILLLSPLLRRLE